MTVNSAIRANVTLIINFLLFLNEIKGSGPEVYETNLTQMMDTIFVYLSLKMVREWNLFTCQVVMSLYQIITILVL